MFLRLGLNQDLLPLNMKREILLNTSKNAMALLQGATGSGKTFLLNRMFAYCEYDLEQSGDDATVILCDFKGDDSFKEYRGCKGYYAFMECIEGIERFWSIFKDRQQGNPDRSFNACLLHVREVMIRNVLCGASAFIVAHNHPSGELSVSKDDISTTEQLKKAGELMGILLLDHIIIGRENEKEAYYSMKEHGFLSE